MTVMSAFYSSAGIVYVIFCDLLPDQSLSELDNFYQNNPEHNWNMSFQHWYCQNSVRYFSTEFLMRATNVTVTVFSHCSEANQLY